MKSGGRRKKTAGVRLLDLWTPPPLAGRPVACIATTFTFDPGHFEEECLARFLGMESDARESTLEYRLEREGSLTEAYACVLVDQRHARGARALRWDVLPVRLPMGGIQHAKLTVLIWQHRWRLLIGSANLTEPGYRQNQEIIAKVEGGDGETELLALKHEAIGFLKELLRFVPEATGASQQGPVARLRRFLDAYAAGSSDVATPADRDTGVSASLVPVYPGGTPLPTTLKKLWRGNLPDELTVLSPFFDREDWQIEKVHTALTALLVSRGDRQLTFIAPGFAKGNSNVPEQVLIPERLVRCPDASCGADHALAWVSDRVASEAGLPGDDAVTDVRRALHAKALVLRRDADVLLLIGSSNCTVMGLGLNPKRANLELNIAYRFGATAGAFGRDAMASLPPHFPVDYPDQVQFCSPEIDEEVSAESEPALPMAFVEARYVAATDNSDGGYLELWWQIDLLPSEFRIECAEAVGSREPLLEIGAGRPVTSLAQPERLPVACPVSVVSVSWLGSDAQWHQADWVVNVEDPRYLPPPVELQTRSLTNLCAILSSKLAPHQALGKLSAVKLRSEKAPNVVVNALKRVDTSTFLLRRMRDLAQGLEGLQHRLGQPMSSTTSLHNRLYGPFGPIALAEAVLAEVQSSAPFFIAEIATTLMESQLRCLPPLTPKEAGQTRREALRKLYDLVLQNEMPINPALKDDVDKTFARWFP